MHPLPAFPHSTFHFRISTLVALLLVAVIPAANAAPARIVFVAGPPSHGPGDHEYAAGLKLLARCLADTKQVEPVVVTGGWPADEKVFDGAKSIVLFMDGGGAHPLLRAQGRMETLGRLMARGVGLVCIHYTVEFPPGPSREKVLDWLGGYYEIGYSTNPMNDIAVAPNPAHEIARGVHEFRLVDEWYYRIRFRTGDTRVMPILTTMLPKDNPELQTIAWATVRADGGRAFGFTGGHFHRNWGVPEFRKVVLNAILWTAHLKVPANGVESTVTPEQLKENMDKKP